MKKIEKKAVKKVKNATLYPTFYKLYVTTINGVLFGTTTACTKKMKVIIKYLALTPMIKQLSHASGAAAVFIVAASLVHLWAACISVVYTHLWGDFPSNYFFFDWPSFEEIITALSDLEPPTPNEEKSDTGTPKDAGEEKPRYNRSMMVLSLVVSLAVGVATAFLF
jgi:hypothetical protein